MLLVFSTFVLKPVDKLQRFNSKIEKRNEKKKIISFLLQLWNFLSTFILLLTLALIFVVIPTIMIFGLIFGILGIIIWLIINMQKYVLLMIFDSTTNLEIVKMIYGNFNSFLACLISIISLIISIKNSKK